MRGKPISTKNMTGRCQKLLLESDTFADERFLSMVESVLDKGGTIDIQLLDGEKTRFFYERGNGSPS